MIIFKHLSWKKKLLTVHQPKHNVYTLREKNKQSYLRLFSSPSNKIMHIAYIGLSYLPSQIGKIDLEKIAEQASKKHETHILVKNN